VDIDSDEFGVAAASTVGHDLPAWARAIGLVFYGIAGALSAVIEILLIPIRHGTVYIPVAVVLAVASNIVLPRLSRNLAGSTIGALPPVIMWILVTITLQSSRPEGDVLVPGGGSIQYVSYGVMLGGVFTGLISVLVAGGRRR
jgi:hypothetical protein